MSRIAGQHESDSKTTILQGVNTTRDYLASDLLTDENNAIAKKRVGRARDLENQLECWPDFLLMSHIKQ